MHKKLFVEQPSLVNRKGLILLHDNTRPHVSQFTIREINELGCETLKHPPYSPDLSPTDYHFFHTYQFNKDKSCKVELKGIQAYKFEKLSHKVWTINNFVELKQNDAPTCVKCANNHKSPINIYWTKWEANRQSMSTTKIQSENSNQTLSDHVRHIYAHTYRQSMSTTKIQSENSNQTLSDQSSDLYPVKNMWDKLDYRIRKIPIYNKNELIGKLTKEYASVSVEYLKVIISNMSKHLKQMIQQKGYATKYLHYVWFIRGVKH
ncbi:Histone-lysine N-methyltransferase SETMAR [Habropoda laboriosa]|uniref:Histone-lysine N-methyltransferase SETMAR n=1 Tax=Habropoda laboriosa TaxID=597456 RepID=A0A0L7QQD3_9HYME|nr:Histone-lysine N-methyltransferase SETMAR [Habropoda laboriosa]